MMDHTQSAQEFVQKWSNLFVGSKPEIEKGIEFFSPDATVLLPGCPYRIDKESDKQQIAFSHLQDGRGKQHFWQVLEPRAQVYGDIAIVTSYARYNIGRDGESSTGHAKDTLVLRRKDNDWQIVHLHTSTQ